jgi:hypothetical protein
MSDAYCSMLLYFLDNNIHLAAQSSYWTWIANRDNSYDSDGVELGQVGKQRSCGILHSYISHLVLDCAIYVCDEIQIFHSNWNCNEIKLYKNIVLKTNFLNNDWLIPQYTVTKCACRPNMHWRAKVEKWLKCSLLVHGSDFHPHHWKVFYDLMSHRWKGTGN